MFKKREDFVDSIDSLIGENIKIVGKIEGKGSLRIDGIVEGDIDYDGSIVIGIGGKVIGNIKTGDVSLGGTVNGNIVSNSKVVILDTGTLIGDLEVPTVVIHENARFEGNCKMPGITDKNSKENPKTEKAKA